MRTQRRQLLFKSQLKHSYTQSTFYNVNNQFIDRKKALISQCKNEITQTKREHKPNNRNSLSTTQKNCETDPAQQKQRKQLILTDSKNVFS